MKPPAHTPRPLSDAARSVQPGTYRHFKGGLYEVVGVARHSEHRDEEFVVYRSHEYQYLWIRPLAMFLEHVEREGYSGPRFTKIADSEQ